MADKVNNLEKGPHQRHHQQEDLLLDPHLASGGLNMLSKGRETFLETVELTVKIIPERHTEYLQKRIITQEILALHLEATLQREMHPTNKENKESMSKETFNTFQL